MRSVEDRFWSYVDKSEGPTACWPWRGARDANEYGAFQLPKKLVGAHRFAWFLSYGDPGQLFICHHCDNPPCCNPSHLFIGTAQDNTTDCVLKLRHVHGEAVHTSKLKEADIYAIQEKRREGASIQSLATEYDVTLASIVFVLTGRTWKHITNPTRNPPGRLHCSNPNATLTPDDVLEILSLRGTVTCTMLAKKFGVHISTIENIFAGNTWKNLSDPDGTVARRQKKDTKIKLTPDDVREIRLLHGTMRMRDIAAKFGVSLPLIEKIMARKVWRDIE